TGTTKPANSRAGASTEVSTTWPHTFTTSAGSATVYEPQVVSWPDRQTLNTRIVVGLTPTGAKEATLGTIDVSFSTSTDLATRWVTLYNGRLEATRFPSLPTDKAVAAEGRIRAALEALGDKRVPLDTLLLSLRQQAEKPPEVTVNNEPPVIFV